MIKSFLPAIMICTFCCPVLCQSNMVQPVIGKGNARALAIAKKSPLIQSNFLLLKTNVLKIKNKELRKTTMDAINNPRTILKHRAGLSLIDKISIIQELIRNNLVDTADEKLFPGGLMAGIFPPVLNDGTSSASVPQPFEAAPGSIWGDHHSYPGGLVMHESFTQVAAISLGQGYKRVYGSTGNDGLPVYKTNADEAGLMDIDLLIAASVWHDWAKIFVSQWNEDGSIFKEFNFGGNGSTDRYGRRGSSKEQGHHILGIAEMMSRNIAPDVIIAVAACHGVPTAYNEFMVVNWLRTAAIISRIDPVQKGFLYMDSLGHYRMKPLRSANNLHTTGNLQNHSQMLAEYALQQLGDGDWMFTNPAAHETDFLLEKLATEYGYSVADTATYNWKFRNVILGFLSSERISLIYGNKGIDGVLTELNKLRKKKII